MRTTVIYNHPYDGSFNHAILETVIDALKSSGQDIDVMNLDEDHFNPVMSSDDLLGFVKHHSVDQQAKDYSARIRQADHLIFIFPIWWEMMPAMMKGFVDKVIFPGETFNYTKNGLGMVSMLNKLRSTTVITTMNTPKLMYRFLYGNAVQKAMIKGTFQKSGMKHVKWISLNMVKMVSAKKREHWLGKISTHCTKLAG
jgi:putative NADPH-quinone reductase